jgi:hypothetical protein
MGFNTAVYCYLSQISVALLASMVNVNYDANYCCFCLQKEVASTADVHLETNLRRNREEVA